MSAVPMSPPWILFTDQNKPVAILAAGRPGEVANVKGLSLKTAMAIVNAANEPIRDAHVQLAEASKRILAIHDEITSATTGIVLAGSIYAQFERLSDEERAAFVEEIGNWKWCVHCGRDSGGKICHCENDE